MFSISDFTTHLHLEMDELSKSSNVDFPNLIALALQKSLPWDSLSIIVDNVTLTQKQSKSVIKILLKELQKLQENLNDQPHVPPPGSLTAKVLCSYVL